MEFKSLKNIESSFRMIRFSCLIFLCLCAGITGLSVIKAYQFAELQRQKIYVLDQGKSLILALQQDAAQNRPVEAKEHLRRFHELFFTLAPDKSAIESNIRRALYLSDKSVYNYYKDLADKQYYNRIISGNIIQRIEVDSIVCNFNNYPFEARTYARQLIIRESSITERTLVSTCELLNSVKSDNNPQGFCIESFEILENKDLKTIER